MITKLATFRGVSSTGEPLVRLFEPASAMVKEAGYLMPPVKDWLNGYQRNDGKLVVLVNALGASEYYGANVNGDDFPEAALIHDCRNHKDQQHPIDDFTGKPIPPYGYWTFLNALPFKHHQNKDPNRAFGNVAVACWNPKMHRVELVVVLDKVLALQNGAQDVIDRILAGEYPDVSMGTRVPYDVCTICGNKSKTRNDYCSCVKNIGLGKILDDGRRIAVINPHPRFFDISFVFIGADKTAKVMCKLASATGVPSSVSDAAALYNLQENAEGLIKAACGVGTCRECVRGCQIYVKKAAYDPMDSADTRLIMGRTDNQDSPSVIGDGILRTNLGTRDEEESAGVDRGSGFKPDGMTSELNAALVDADVRNYKAIRDALQRRKIEGYLPRLSPANVWTADASDNANLNKVSSDSLEETFTKARGIKVGPPPVPNRKEHPFVGTINHRGITIHVENKPGDVREGKGWKTLMKLPYGEILGSKGTDGDKLDVYVGPWEAENVYVIHQNFISGPRAGKYDEDKVMLGFESPEQAKAAYLAHYSNPRFFRSITTMAFPLFKKAIVRKEAHGEKLASICSAEVANLLLEDEFQTSTPEDSVKIAASLDELFSCGGSARRRQRVWRDTSTGDEVRVTGSGDGSKVEHTKTASVDIAAVKLARVLNSGWSPEDLLKVSNETKVSHLKWADIVKRIGPSKAVGRVSPLLSQTEPSLPVEVLNKLGEEPNLEKSLATPALMGMALKPEEFQRIILVHIGKGDLADKLDEEKAVAAPTEESTPPCAPLDASHFDDSILKDLLPFLEGKSYAGPVVRRRIIRIIHLKPSSHSPSTEVDSPLLSKVASAYTWYRKEIMKLASALPTTVVSHPELHSRTLGLSTEDMFSKTAAGPIGLDRRSITMLLGSIPLSLLYSAHKRQQMERGDDVGLWGTLVAEHPWLTSMGVVSGLGALLRDPKTRQAVDRALEAGDRVWQGGQYVARRV